jgi:purine catabolism regulator
MLKDGRDMNDHQPPTVSLFEVLHLALPPGSRPLTGEAQLDKRIHWARLLKTRPGGLSPSEPSELLLLPATFVESLSDARTAARLLHELTEAGAAAFVVAGALPVPVFEAVEASGRIVFEVPERTPLPDVERAVIGLILDRDAQLRRRVEEDYGRLLATMLANAGLPSLVSALAGATGLRVAVLDDYLTLQACSEEASEFREPLMTALTATLPRDGVAGAGRASEALTLEFQAESTSWRGRLYPLRIGDAWAGLLTLLGRPGETSEADRMLADRAADLVALELAKQRAVAEATQRWRGEFLADLLEGNFPTDDAALARARQLGYDLLRPHVLFMLAPDPPGPGAGWVDAERAAARNRRRFSELARQALPRLQPRALSIDREGTLVAVLGVSRDSEPDELCALVEPTRYAIEQLLGAPVSAGISRVLDRPTAMQKAEPEASIALGVAQRLIGGSRTSHFDQLGVERLLYQLLGHRELEAFVHDVLGSLLAYDAAHRAELVRTVEVFLACNGNHVRAAQELHLHRNTLLYRLERAREVLGRDLEDADTRLAIQVALRIRHAIPLATPDPLAGPRRSASRRRRIV